MYAEKNIDDLIILLSYYRDAYIKYEEILSLLRPMDSVPTKEDILQEIFQIISELNNRIKGGNKRLWSYMEEFCYSMRWI